jgi:hypothetical protein
VGEVRTVLVGGQTETLEVSERAVPGGLEVAGWDFAGLVGVGDDVRIRLPKVSTTIDQTSTCRSMRSSNSSTGGMQAVSISKMIPATPMRSSSKLSRTLGDVFDRQAESARSDPWPLPTRRRRPRVMRILRARTITGNGPRCPHREDRPPQR